MKLKVALTALVLATAPLSAFAMCAGDHAKESASNCALGSHWDAAQEKCVPTTSS